MIWTELSLFAGAVMGPFLRFFIQYRWNVFAASPELNETPM
jgi:hypothetical protein